MGINPIDMQVMIPRSVEVSRVQQTTENQLVAQQQDLTAQTKKIAEQRSYQVQLLNQKDESGKIKREQGKKEEQKKKKKHNRYGSDANLEEEEEEEENTGMSIDIKF